MLLSNGGWLLRVVTVTVLLGVIGLSLFPRLVSHISASAIVNAPILVIRSPVEGHVNGTTLAAGTVIAEGQDLAVFLETGADPTHPTELEARMGIADAAVRATEERIAEVEALQDSLDRRHGAYRTWHVAVLQTEIDELEAQLDGARARLALARAAAARSAELTERRIVPASEQEEAETEVSEQIARVGELEARLAGRRLQLSASEDDILAGTAGTNTPYTLQRQDEVRLELARLRDELTDHRSERDAIEAQLSVALAVFDRESAVTLASPIDGIVWRAASLSGRPVLPGDEVVEILDCRARYLEAFLPEGLAGRISVGDLAEVRLTGDARAFSAPVASILGHGARADHVELAANDTSPKAGMMRVIIELPPRLSVDPAEFCDVGRTAQVSLPRDLSGVLRLADYLSTNVRAVFAWFETTSGDIGRG